MGDTHITIPMARLIELEAAERTALRAATKLRALLGGLERENDALRAERDALAQFSLAMLESWPLGDVDGGSLQDHAVKHGLLVPEQRTAPCSEEGCNCAEYYGADEWAEGITCYRRAPWLLAASAGGSK